MLHRAIFGSIERFLGILIEHYAGALPLWLAPVQVVVLPIADRHKEAAEDLARRLKAAGRARGGVRPERAMREKIARRRRRRCPTWWCWATRRSRTAPFPCATATKATWAPGPPSSCWTGSARPRCNLPRATKPIEAKGPATCGALVLEPRGWVGSLVYDVFDIDSIVLGAVAPVGRCCALLRGGRGVRCEFHEYRLGLVPVGIFGSQVYVADSQFAGDDNGVSHVVLVTDAHRGGMS